MYMWVAFKRIVRAGFIGFWRNAFVSVSAIFVMTVTLFVIASTLFLNTILDVSLQNIQEKVDINVYFVTSADEEDIFNLQTSLEALPDVQEVTYTSREAALASFTERYRTDETIMQGIEELGNNPLGASLSIRAAETNQYAGIAEFIEEQQNARGIDDPLISEVNYLKNQSAIDNLTTIINAVERSSLVAMLVLVIAAVLITFNTIRLAIYTTREEIGVMRLVGASNTYIRGPFMLQGVMYGIVAGVCTLLILYPILMWLGPATEAFFQFNILSYYIADFPRLFAIVVGSGVILGLISSTLAVTRYLRV